MLWEHGGFCFWTLITKPVKFQSLLDLDKWSRECSPAAKHMQAAVWRRLLNTGCWLWTHASLEKFNFENTGQSLMHHQRSQYRVKWAPWQSTTLISLKTAWQVEQYNTPQHVANSRNTNSWHNSVHFMITPHLSFCFYYFKLLTVHAFVFKVAEHTNKKRLQIIFHQL